MINHPSRGRVAPLQIKRQDGTWGEATTLFAELGKDGFGATDETRASARGIIAAVMTGYGVKDESGRARTVVEFSGDSYDAWLAGNAADDPVLRAFINPLDGSLRRDALDEAARLLLEQRQ